jgi:hypothetical protein
MPKILERLVSQLEAKGKPKQQAYAIATSALQKSGNLKPGTQKATEKGRRRGEMGAAGRAKDRAAKESGKHKPSEYGYNPKTNRASLKR